MTDEKVSVFEIVKIGGIPDNMIYWSTPIAKDDPWCEAVNSDWQIEVDFHD